MAHPFFPDPIFGWVFCLVLMALLVVAAYQDVRRMVVPKWITLPMLALGLLFNLVRGVWLTGDAWGLLDGLLVSLGGFAAGFVMFLLMYVLGTCGGGDVKLFAAAGAWVGPLIVVYLLIGTLACVVVMTFARVAGRLVTGRGLATPRPSGTPTRGTAKNRLLTYSLPLALSAAVVLFWVFRVELHLAETPHRPTEVGQVRTGP
jgi:prepilin peptidase CpaA